MSPAPRPIKPPDKYTFFFRPAERTRWTERCIDYDFKYGQGYFPNDKLTEVMLKRVTAYYYATISQIDYHVGRMVKVLKQKGLYDQTLIAVTSDHGDYMGFHHMLLKGNYMYDPVVKVPLILKWPGNQQRGMLSKRLVNNIDLAPTLCLAAGCKPAETMYGYALQDENAGHKIIFAEAESGRQVMARSQNRKLILATPRGKDLFFDLEKDPLEKNNLYDSSEYREERKQMETALAGWRCQDSTPEAYQDEKAPTIRQPNVPPQDLSHRQAIIRYCREKMLAFRERS